MESDNYEGLSVNVAKRLFSKYKEALEAHGIDAKDVEQQARLIWLTLKPKLDYEKYAKPQHIRYAISSIQGALTQWIHQQLGKLPKPDDIDLQEDPPAPTQEDPEGLADLDTAMAQLDPLTKKLLLLKYSGHSISAIVRESGMTRTEVERVLAKGLGELRRRML